MIQRPVIGFIYFFFIQFCSLFQAHSQHYEYTQYTVEDGLPSNETYAVHEDHAGYIWIGTDRGVVRYNGYEFETFTTSDGAPDNTIFGFREAPDSSLWFLTFNQNLGKYKDGVFNTYIQKGKGCSFIIENSLIDILYSGDTFITQTYHGTQYYVCKKDAAYWVMSKKERRNCFIDFGQKLNYWSLKLLGVNPTFFLKGVLNH